MNEHELELALDAIGEQRTRVTTPPVLRARVRTVPLETPPRSLWGRLTHNGGAKSMFSATKLMFAGVALAMSGAFLVSGILPGSDQQTIPGAEASPMDSTEPALDAAATTTEPITAVSGRFGVDGAGVPETSELAGGGKRQVLRWPHLPVDVSDERLDAELVLTETVDHYRGVRYQRMEMRIETADGAWQMEPISSLLGERTGRDRVGSAWVGEGAYDGLRLIANIDFFGHGFDFEGFIVEEAD